MRNTVSELQVQFSPFGYLDLQAVCEIWEEVELHEGELFEIIDDARESIGYQNWDNFDPVYCVLDHVLQIARNYIDEITGYDFVNDYSGRWSEIYVYGNFMCSRFDYSESAIEELKEKIAPYIEKLTCDKFTKYFLSEIGITEAS